MSSSAAAMAMIDDLGAVRAGEPLRQKMRIAGALVGGERTLDVRNPYTGALVGTVPKATVDDVRRAFVIARGYRAKLTRHDRYRICYRAAEILRAHTQQMSDLITAECGIGKKDSLYEVGRACDVFTFAGNAALSDDGQIFSCDLTPHGKSRKVYTLREPLLGAISAITPFNHPLNQVAHKVAPAIATNNRMVLKPTEKTPLSALLLADILYEAGLPPEMFSVVTGDPKEIADEMLVNPHVDLVTFTGGVPIGKYIAAKAVYKRQVLELGRQRPDHRDGRRRPRRGRGAGGRRLVQELGPAVHGDQADAGPREGRRRVRRAAAGADPRLEPTATRWMRRSTWARSSTRRPRSPSSTRSTKPSRVVLRCCTATSVAARCTRRRWSTT